MHVEWKEKGAPPVVLAKWDLKLGYKYTVLYIIYTWTDRIAVFTLTCTHIGEHTFTDMEYTCREYARSGSTKSRTWSFIFLYAFAWFHHFAFNCYSLTLTYTLAWLVMTFHIRSYVYLTHTPRDLIFRCRPLVGIFKQLFFFLRLCSDTPKWINVTNDLKVCFAFFC